MKQSRQQKEAVAAIVELGGDVQYDYQFDQSGKSIPDAVPTGPAPLRMLFGEDFFTTVVGVSFVGSAVTDTDLQYLEGMTYIRTLELMARRSPMLVWIMWRD